MGQGASQPLESPVCPIRFVTCNDNKSEDTLENVDTGAGVCFPLARPLVRRLSSIKKDAWSPPIQYAQDENDDTDESRNTTARPLHMHAPDVPSVKCDILSSTSPLALQAVPSVASTVNSIDSWSLKSMATASASTERGGNSVRHLRQGGPRIVDVYQTDATLVLDEEAEDWGPLVFRCSQTRLQLPFRSCHRKRCFCKRKHQDQYQLSNKERFLNSHSSDRRRQPSDHDLQGLWIPVGDRVTKDENGSNGLSPSRGLKWMKKSSSERNIMDASRSRSKVFLKQRPGLPIQPRSRAVSEDLILQQPRIFPPLLDTASSDSGSLAFISKASPLKSTSSAGTLISIDSIPSGNITASSSTTSQKSVSSTVLSNQRERASGSFELQPQEDDNPRRQRSRIRSEDVIDQRSGQAPLGLPTELVVEPPTSDDASLCSTPNRSRGYSRDVFTPAVKQANEVNSKGVQREKTVPVSPTSVMGIHPPIDQNMPFALKVALSGSQAKYAAKMKEYRQLIDEVKVGNLSSRSERLMIVDCYHALACLHLQHSRTNPALCVVDRALEVFFTTQSDRKKTSRPCLTLKDTLACVENGPEKSVLADLLVTKSTILLFDTTASAGRCLPESNVKDLAKAAVSLLRATSQEAPREFFIKAKALAIVGRVYASETRPGPALDYLNRALTIFRFLANSDQSSLEYFPQIAETCLHIGCLHVEHGVYDRAKRSLWEALVLFRYLLQGSEDFDNKRNFLLLAAASAAAQLGWVHIQQGSLDWAQRSTVEALWLLEEHRAKHAAVPRSLRNLATVEYQLGLIASKSGHTSRALACWHSALSSQKIALPAGHPDMALSMEALGSAYQLEARWAPAQSFLDGALGIRRRTKDYAAIARLQGQLALVMLHLGQADRAGRMVRKARTGYKKLGLPLDDHFREACHIIAMLHEDRLNA